MLRSPSFRREARGLAAVTRDANAAAAFETRNLSGARGCLARADAPANRARVPLVVAAAVRISLATVLLTACVAGPRGGGMLHGPVLPDEPVRWTPARDGRAIALWIDSARTTPGWRAEFVGLVDSAAAAWGDAGAPVRFRRVATPYQADVLVRWRRWQRGPARGTTTRWIRGRGELVRAEVTIVLAPGPGRVVSPPGVLRAIALHELGHALGLADEALPGAIMCGSLSRPTLTERDRRALRLAYGEPPASLSAVRRASSSSELSALSRAGHDKW